MTTHYPPFALADDEFLCLKKDLSAVGWFIEWQQLQDQLAETDQTITNMVRQLGLPHSTVIDQLLFAVENARPVVGDETRKAEAVLLYQQYASLITRELQTEGVRHNIRGVVNDLVRLYVTPSLQQLRSDLSDSFNESSPEQIELTSRINELNQQKKEIVKKITSHRKAIRAVFEFLPETFRGVKAPEADESPESVVRRIQFAVRIVSAFIQCWRQRAPLFALPTTPNGIAIHTLPVERSGLWQAAYDALELGSIPKRLTYAAQTSPDRNMKEARVFTDGVN
jgi:hypothetical protein